MIYLGCENYGDTSKNGVRESHKHVEGVRESARQLHYDACKMYHKI